MALESPEAYCRAIEAYLCRKNDGHLIRIVGPAFEQVLAWAARGVPFTVACHGIDRYFERYYAKGTRRRPVRIEFCEADVFDAFDEWRRAVGVAEPPRESAGSDGGAAAEAPPRRQASLPAHLDRVIARLTTLRGGANRALDDALEAVIRELDGYRASARAVRGQPRSALLERLAAIDVGLLEAARRACDPATLARLAGEAAEELAPFKDRMSAAAFEQSQRTAVDRLVRERARLPVVSFE